MKQFCGYSAREKEVKVDDDENSIRIGDIVLNKSDGLGPYVPGEDAILANTKTTNRYLAQLAEMVRAGPTESALLVGPTGSAKTSLVRYLAYLTNNNFARLNLDAYTDTSEIIGSYVPVEDKEGEFRVERRTSC